MRKGNRFRIAGLLAFFLVTSFLEGAYAQYHGIWKDDASAPTHNFYIQHYATGSSVVLYTKDGKTFYAFLADMSGSVFEADSTDAQKARSLRITFTSEDHGSAVITDNTGATPVSLETDIVKTFVALRTQHSGIWKDTNGTFNMYVQEYSTGSCVVVYTFDSVQLQAFLGQIDQTSFSAYNVADQSEEITVDFDDVSAANVKVNAADFSPALLPGGDFEFDMRKEFPPLTLDFDISATPRYGTAPVEIQFEDLSTISNTSWSWDFGDGGASTEKNPKHIYTQPGTYDVLLTLTFSGDELSLLMLWAHEYIHVFETSDPVISGTITKAEGGTGLPYAAVDFSNGAGLCTADGEGYYVRQVPNGWTGGATPSLSGYSFDPADRSYLSVASDKPGGDYVASRVRTVPISGWVSQVGSGVGGVTLTLNNGVGNATTDSDGYYLVFVPMGWSGTATPSKEGVVFEPPDRTYVDVNAARTDQDYTPYVEITGIIDTLSCTPPHIQVPMSGVTVTAVGGSGSWTDTTSSTGYYIIRVPLGWSGTVTPSQDGWVFSPGQTPYQNLPAGPLPQLYFGGKSDEASIVSGKVTLNGDGLSGVTITFDNGGGTAVTDNEGAYSIELGPVWSGYATPSLDGYVFNPSEHVFTPFLPCDMSGVDFEAAADTVTVTISGTITQSSGGAGLSGVTVAYTGGSTSTDSSGDYSFEVSYGWSGTVTPSKTGYTFSPASKTFSNVSGDETQDFVGTISDVTVSGTVYQNEAGLGVSGVAGVVITYHDWLYATGSATTTDSSGYYSFEVKYGWSGTLMPSKAGYEFSPASRSLGNVTSNQADQNFLGTTRMFIISGTITASPGSQPLHETTVSYSGGATATNSSGYYSFEVSHGWSGTVTPSKSGYTFSPTSKSFSNVTGDRTQDFVGTPPGVTISGLVYQNEGGLGVSGVASVTISYTGGSTTTDSSGYYSFEVNYGWSGTLTPSKAGYDFSPASRSLGNVTSNQTDQNFLGTTRMLIISGTITASPGSQPLHETTVSYSGGATTTDGSGYYSFQVPYGWSGTVTPSRIGFSFSPSSRSYSNVTSDQTNQDYSASVHWVGISGTITSSRGGQPVAGVTVNSTGYGWITSTTTDASGNYTLSLSAGTDAVVTPSKAGSSFLPPSRSYTNLTTSRTGEDFVAVSEID